MVQGNHKSPEEVIITKLSVIETVLLGVAGTDDKGLVGDVKYVRQVSETHATRLDTYGEAIVAINTRCEERTGCAPMTPAEIKEVREYNSKWKRNLKTGGILTAILGAIAAIAYAIAAYFKGG